MAGEWRTLTVQQLVDEGVLERPIDGNHGEIHPKTIDFVERGIPFIMASDLVGGRVDTAHCAFISEEQARSLRKGFAIPGDVLISHKATMGRTAIVDRIDVPFLVLTPQVTYYRVKDQSRLVSRYLKLYFDSPNFQVLFDTWGQKGSTRAYLGITAQLDLPIVVPPPDEQRAIAHILGTLDDKIELNRRMNETLEAIARALFKSWFVGFDPVRAKAEGRDPGLPKHIADLFPDSFEDSELGEIPEGWEINSIGDLADVAGGTTPSTKEPAYWEGGTHAWATPKDLSGLTVPVIFNTERRITDAGLSQIGSGLLPKGTVLLSSRAPIGYLAVAEIPVAINQGFIAMTPKTGTSNIFLLLWASVAHEEIVSRANGSTFLEISKANFRPIPVVTPSADVMRVFEELARPLYERIVESARESRTLAALRDTLLPKLISGEVRVKDSERITARADA
jgi:type I restriction enzyme, S subunit